MTIRTKLTLWYASIMFASVLTISWLGYIEFAHDKAEARAHGTVDEYDAWEDLADISLWCGIPAAAIGLAGGWLLMRKAMAPVAALTRAVSQIHERNLREQIPRAGNGDEMDKLTEVFNAMTVRLDNSFSRIREFTLHASHELKTPLTVMRGELETELNTESEPAKRERLLSQVDEIDRLTKIVDGLTLLTRADAGQIELKREPVQFDDLVRECFADAQILASPQSIRVELPECAPVAIAGDRHRLRQLLLNLTDNAVKYNRPQGVVSISLRKVGESCLLQISNTGPGIPQDLQGRVFDRFFRGDASHNNEIEGCGLGLSIAQWIVTAHTGKIRIDSAKDERTTVTVELPCSSN